MLGSRDSRAAVVCPITTLCLIVLTVAAVSSQLFAQQKKLFDPQLSRQVRCAITVGNDSWSQTSRASVRVRLENLTDNDLDFDAVPTFYLTNAKTDYWSPADIIHDSALAVREHQIGSGLAVSIEPIPVKLHLGRHDISAFEIDLRNTNWERRISSIWPNLSLDKVPPDPYRLRLELSDAAGNLIRSNEVRVTLGISLK